MDLVTVATVGTFLIQLLTPLIENSQKYRQWKIMKDVDDQIFKSQFIKSITNHTDKIPLNDFQSPNPSILIPALDESLLYINEEEIKEMFSKLISSTFDRTKTKYIHPGFIGIIKQLSPMDAQFLMFIKRKIVEDPQNFKVISLINNNQCEYRIFETTFKDFEDIEQCSLSIDNLIRLGILKVNSKDDLFVLTSIGYVAMGGENSYTLEEQTLKIINDNHCDIYPVKAHLTVLGEYLLKVCV